MSKVTNEQLRAKYVDALIEWLKARDEEVLQVASNEIAIPTVDTNGDDQYVVFTIKVPVGDRDGNIYDAYERAQEYTMKVAAKKEKATKAAELKAAKIARDKAEREAKAAAKAKAKAKQ